MPQARNLWWAAGSLMLMVVGAFGPWAKVLVVTIGGTDGGRDGWIVIGAALFAGLVLVLLVRARSRGLAGLTALAGAVAGSTAGYDIASPETLSSDALAGELVSTQWGIYLALVGSISLILASISLLIERRPEDVSAEPAATA